jgi:DNA-directed RNA polymerase subunit RPC12/RpoP
MRGDVVTVADCCGAHLVRRVWHNNEEGVSVCSEDEYERAAANGGEPLHVGFPKAAIVSVGGFPSAVDAQPAQLALPKPKRQLVEVVTRVCMLCGDHATVERAGAGPNDARCGRCGSRSLVIEEVSRQVRRVEPVLFAERPRRGRPPKALVEARLRGEAPPAKSARQQSA